jgi:hypothetical protein
MGPWFHPDLAEFLSRLFVLNLSSGVRNDQPEPCLHYGRGVAGNSAECPFLAHFGHGAMSAISPLCAQKRTSVSANSPMLR